MALVAYMESCGILTLHAGTDAGTGEEGPAPYMISYGNFMKKQASLRLRLKCMQQERRDLHDDAHSFAVENPSVLQ